MVLLSVAWFGKECASCALGLHRPVTTADRKKRATGRTACLSPATATGRQSGQHGCTGWVAVSIAVHGNAACRNVSALVCRPSCRRCGSEKPRVLFSDCASKYPVGTPGFSIHTPSHRNCPPHPSCRRCGSGCWLGFTARVNDDACIGDEPFCRKRITQCRFPGRTERGGEASICPPLVPLPPREILLGMSRGEHSVGTGRAQLYLSVLARFVSMSVRRYVSVIEY